MSEVPRKRLGVLATGAVCEGLRGALNEGRWVLYGIPNDGRGLQETEVVAVVE